MESFDRNIKAVYTHVSRGHPVGISSSSCCTTATGLRCKTKQMTTINLTSEHQSGHVTLEQDSCLTRIIKLSILKLGSSK